MARKKYRELEKRKAMQKEAKRKIYKEEIRIREFKKEQAAKELIVKQEDFVRKSYDKTIELIERAAEKHALNRDPLNYKTFKAVIDEEAQFIGSVYNNKEEVVEWVSNNMYLKIFNDYEDKKVRVYTRKQAEKLYEGLQQMGVDLRGVTVENIMTGEFDVNYYWKQLSSVFEGNLGMMTMYFFGS